MRVTLIAIAVFTALCFVVGFIRFQDVYTSTDANPVTTAAIRAERLSVFEESGGQISNADFKSNIVTLRRLVSGRANHRMSGTIKYAYMDGGQRRMLQTHVDVSYNRPEKTHTFILTTIGDKDNKFDGLWVPDGTYRVIEEGGKTYFETNGVRTEANDNDEIYTLLMYFGMGELVPVDYLNRSNTDRYSLWDGMLYTRSAGSESVIFENHGQELRTFNNKPVSWRDSFKNGDMEVLIELDFEFPMPPVPASAMARVRTTSFFSALERGKEIDAAALAANMDAIDAFIATGESYRMSGNYQYGYKRSGIYADEIRTTNIEMFYNANLDVYKFTLENLGTQWEENPRLQPYRIAEGTYYILEEDGKTYVLSEIDGIKTATDVSSNRSAYDFLMQFSMENLIDTGFVRTAYKRAVSVEGLNDYAYNESMSHRNGELYRRNPSVDTFDLSRYLYGDRAELKIYEDKPVAYLRSYVVAGSDDVCTERTLSIYYDRIPVDAPSVADWR